MDISGLRVPLLDSHSFARLRLYPASGQFEIMAATRPIFCGAGWEEAGREAPPQAPQRRAAARMACGWGPGLLQCPKLALGL